MMGSSQLTVLAILLAAWCWLEGEPTLQSPLLSLLLAFKYHRHSDITVIVSIIQISFSSSNSINQQTLQSPSSLFYLPSSSSSSSSYVIIVIIHPSPTVNQSQPSPPPPLLSLLLAFVIVSIIQISFSSPISTNQQTFQSPLLPFTCHRLRLRHRQRFIIIQISSCAPIYSWKSDKCKGLELSCEIQKNMVLQISLTVLWQVQLHNSATGRPTLGWHVKSIHLVLL